MSFLTVEDLQENMGNNTIEAPRYSSLIKAQGPDAAAAFDRIQILRRTRKNLERAINDTNLSGLTPTMASMYNSLGIIISDIIDEEMKQVRDGESW